MIEVEGLVVADGTLADFAAGGEVDAEPLGERIAELAAHIHAATYELLRMIAEFDRSGEWGAMGCVSTAHFLNWRIGLDLVTARQKVRVALALESLPVISDAFRLGQLSYSKVRALCRIASAGNEESLVILAKASTASQLEKFVRGYRKADTESENGCANERHAERYLRYFTDDDGMLVVQARLAPEEGARFVKAIELGESILDSAESSSEQYSDVEASKGSGVPQPTDSQSRKADALALVLETALQSEERKLGGGDRHQVVVHVDAEVLANGDEDGRCQLENGQVLAPATLRRLGCDCGVVTMTHGESGEVLNVGRKTRTIPSAIRRALRHRQPGCAFPGCSHERYLHAHHVEHWADGGETSLDNLLHLCSFHHQLVHEGGFSVEFGEGTGDAGDAVFRGPDGAVVSPFSGDGVLGSVGAAVQRNREAGLNLAADTIPCWEGETFDCGWAVYLHLKHRDEDMN